MQDKTLIERFVEEVHDYENICRSRKGAFAEGYRTASRKAFIIFILFAIAIIVWSC